MRVAWATDIHFNFVDLETRRSFYKAVQEAAPDVLLLGGDIGEANTLESYLLQLEQHLACPIYFVLGNHDFYRGSIRAVRAVAQRLHKRSSRLHWLPACGVVPLGKQTGLIGHGGWGDGRCGLGLQSPVVLNDYYLIRDFQGLSKEDYFRQLSALGEAAAHFLEHVLPEALKRFCHVLFLTHVPPFREASWHEGRLSDDEYLPHFSCQAVGDVLLEVMSAHPEHQLTVLCGHTHSPGAAHLLPNLIVKTGGAEYGEPRLQEIIAVG